MKTKMILVVLAMVLVLGVSPVVATPGWENGNWVPDTSHPGYTVVYNPATDTTNKYRDIDPIADLAKNRDMSVGTIRGNIRCGYNTLTPRIGVRNDIDTTGSFTFFPTNMDGTPNPIGKFGPDGVFEIELIPGSYTFILPDGNGGQTEYSHAKVVAGVTSQPMSELIGHCISQSTPAIISTPSSECHDHRIWIFGHFEYFDSRPHWRWVPGHWYTWTCCIHHCNYIQT